MGLAAAGRKGGLTVPVFLGIGRGGRMAQVGEDEVLLLWRAVRAFRSGARPQCKPQGRPPRSDCPLEARCPRWRGGPDDRLAMLDETLAQTEARRAGWPCSRVLDLLSPGVTRISSG